MLTYFIWNASSEVFSTGPLTLRWNALLLIIGFLGCRQLLLFIYNSEGKTSGGISSIPIYIALAALIGGRLGKGIFFEPGSILSKGLFTLLPIKLESGLHLLGTEEFSIHGAVIGGLFVLWLFNRKKNREQGYLQLLDRTAVAATLFGVFFFMAGFLNTEISGKPTGSPFGTIFTKPVVNGLMKVPCCVMSSPGGKNPLDKIEVKKDLATIRSEKSNKSITLSLFFQLRVSDQLVNEFLVGDVKAFLYRMSKFVYEPGTEPLHFKVHQETNGRYVAVIKTEGLARYPVQVFEAIGCLVLFVFLFSYWRKHKISMPAGRLFGFFMILFWSLHFCMGFLKEKTVSVEIGLNILFVLGGIIVLVHSNRSNSDLKTDVGRGKDPKISL